MTRAQKAVLPLAIVSVVMFASLFFGAKIAGLGLLLWVFTVGWTMYKTMFTHVPLNKLIETNDNLTKEAWKKKNVTETSVRLLALPMSIIGLLVVVLNIVMMMFFM